MENNETQEVRDWRESEFRALGFSELDSKILAASTVDLGRMRDLVGQGCDPETAWRILL